MFDHPYPLPLIFLNRLIQCHPRAERRMLQLFEALIHDFRQLHLIPHHQRRFHNFIKRFLILRHATNSGFFLCESASKLEGSKFKNEWD